MASIITMPRLSPTMEEGVLLKWTKKAGDKIMPGDVIAEVETDKANMDFPLEDEGTLLKLLVAEGTTVKLGMPVAVLGEPGEDADAALAEAGAAAPKAAPAPTTTAAAATPAAAAAAPSTTPADADRDEGKTEPATAPAPAAAPSAAVAPTPPAAAPTPAAAAPAQEPAAAVAPTPPAAAAPAQEPAAAGLRASPLARKLAFERGLDLRALAGTGPGGRVIKRDIEAAARPAAPATAPVAAAPVAAAAAAPAPVAAQSPARPVEAPRPAPAAPTGADQVIPLSPMRRTIARRLTEAKATVPHFYVTMDAAADALFAFHQQIKGATDVKITLNDLVLKAVAVALRRVPEANVSFTDAGLVRHGRVDIGMAVSIEDGLVTPVLRNADKKSLGTIALETRDLIERARARKLKDGEFTGATFSVSNMGMLGVKAFSAVINPPEGGILAVGAVEKRAVVEAAEDGGDHIVARRMMTLTLSVDHRSVDGALGARLLGEIVKAIQSPFSLVL